MNGHKPYSLDESWREAWQQWVGLARGWGVGNPGAANADPAAGVDGPATAYVQFAKMVQELLRDGGPTDFTSNFIAALSRAGTGARSTAQDALYSFLTAVPLTIGAQCLKSGTSGAGEALLKTLSAWTSEFLDLPAVGPQRDWQTALQRMQRAMLAQEQAARVLTAHYQRASAAALERFGKYLGDRSGAPITSVRALYDAWVEHAEAAYADRLESAEFAQAFAAWVNAGSQVRLATRALADRIAGVLDLPQRAEINALIERQRRLYLEVEHLRAGLEQRSPDQAQMQADAGRPTAKRSSGSQDTRAVAGIRTGVRPDARKKRKAAKRTAKPAAHEFDIERILAGSD